jgi:hypothetical protein
VVKRGFHDGDAIFVMQIREQVVAADFIGA